MRIAEICVKHPVFATMLTAFLTVMGLVSMRGLGVDLYPKVDFPTVTVTVLLPGSGPEEMESQVTKPVEEALNTINGIEDLRSSTIEGVTRIFVTFILERDVEQAAQDVREKISTVLADLPPDVQPPIVEKFDPDSTPILSITVSSAARSLREITELTDKRIKQRLETVNGVGQVLMVGGRRRQINIILDAKKMQSLGVTVNEVKTALQRENIETPGGKVEQGKSDLSLRVLGRVDVSREFSQIVVASKGATVIKISDLGAVEDDIEKPIKTLSRLDGKDAVTLLVRKQSGTNTVEIVNLVTRYLARISSDLPPDLDVDIIRDQSFFINASIHAIEEHLVLGGLLASLVVLLFMRNLRSTLIAAVAVPTSIVATFAVIKYMGFTLNNYTLLALMLSVGIVIDDAIVVLENIFRFIEEKNYPPMEAAIEATKEIGLAVMATTLSLVVIFVPVAFMSGMTGRFLNSFGLTMASAILLSMLISFTLTPMLSSRFLKPAAHAMAGKNHQRHSSKETGFYAVIDRFYGRMLRWSLAHRTAILLISAVILATIYPAYKAIGKEFFPADDQDEFQINLRTSEGTSLEGTDAILKQVEAEVRKLRGVKHILASINPSGRGSVTEADIYVRMVPLRERNVSQFQVMSDARKMLKQFAGVRSAVSFISPFGSGGRGQGQLEFSIRGPETSQLAFYARRTMDEMQKVPGLIDVDSSLSLGNPELKVKVDREKAADLGVRVSDIASSLRTMVSGEERITKYKEGDEQYEVRLRVLERDRGDAEAISQLMIPSVKLGQVQLSNLATLERGLGPSQIDRYNRQRQLTVYCNLEAWKPLESGVREAGSIVQRLNLPPGYDTQLSGRARRLEETIEAFALAFVLSLVFMYMILASQFDSFIHPITIMTSIPLSIPFALVSLMLTQRTLNIRTALGILLLFGIVKKNGILQIDYTNTLRARGLERDSAIIEANHARLRPILMTTISIIAGLIPAALSKGPGSAQNSGIAIAVIGGQMMCLLITLLLTPVAYSIFDDMAQSRVGERFAAAFSLQRLRQRITGWSASLFSVFK
ncbi:MAG: efflux RND transporter permease subunit [Acidobacteria bacterium]|nr:efflux RND transporter permease subunit [Acidobacteriota bacterium]MCI0621759.1 efflux RND transporter permease subunit [Acidobacteriota bacterium]MCI0718353.1 efflux RND transporter permease subunit [Acidobacteriota bacterium]